MATSEEQQQLSVTNIEALKERSVHVSAASVAGGGIGNIGSEQDSLINPLLSTREIVNVNDLFPQGLRGELQTLVALLEQYYISENTSENSGISALINTLYEQRTIDALDITDQERLNKWFYEFGRSFIASGELDIDPRTFLKHISTLFRQKGTELGIKSFFRFLYDTDPTVYYPWEDVLIASDGRWNGDNQYRISLDGAESELRGFTLSKGEFTSNKGFLDDRIYLQDSFYYQQYSYDIRTELPGEEWENAFKLLLHPAGFIVFATLILALTSKTGKMPYDQFGTVDNIVRTIFQIIIPELYRSKYELFIENDISKIVITIAEIVIEHFNYFYQNTFQLYTFSNGATINEYNDIAIEDLSANIYDFNVSSTISQVPDSSP